MDWGPWSDVVLGAVVFMAASVGTLALTGLVFVRLREDYFCDARHGGFWVGRHSLIRGAGLMFKNLLGALVVAIGIVLALPGVPGPGMLTILLGLMLLDFPGKRGVERWLITRPHVLAIVNGLRRRFDRPPLRVDPTWAGVAPTSAGQKDEHLMSVKNMVSRSGQIVVGVLLLLTIVWAGYSLWDIAIERWFG